MNINKDNIFDFGLTQQNSKKPAPGNTNQDSAKTALLLDLLKEQDISISKHVNYVIVSSNEGISMMNECNPSETHKICDFEAERVSQTSKGSFIAISTTKDFKVLAVGEGDIYSLSDSPNLVYSISEGCPKHVYFSETEHYMALVHRDASVLFDLRKRKEVFNQQVDVPTGVKYESNPIISQSEKEFILIKNITTLAKYKLSFKHRTKYVKEMGLPKGVQISSVYSIFDDNLIVNSAVTKSMLILDSNLFPLFTFDFSHVSYHEAEINFNSDRSKALVTLTNFFDRSGKSYYGLNYLYLIDFRKMKVKQVETVIGPIHHSTWSPNSEEFVIISGSLPAHIIIYNKYGEAKMVLGALYRNFAEWSPDSNKIVVAGFGNIDTKIDVRNCSSLALVGSVKSNHATFFRWCKSSDKYLTAITFDKLKVDNGFRLISCDGTVLTSVDMRDKQLYQVMFSNRNKYNSDESVSRQKEQDAEELIDDKSKPETGKKKLNLIKNDCIKSIMKTEDSAVRFITDYDIRVINQGIEAVQKRSAESQKLKDDEAKAKKEEKAKPQIVLRKGANFKKETDVPKQTEEDGKTSDINANNGENNEQDKGLKRETKETVDKNTQDLLNIVRMMNAS